MEKKYNDLILDNEQYREIFIGVCIALVVVISLLSFLIWVNGERKEERKEQSEKIEVTKKEKVAEKTTEYVNIPPTYLIEVKRIDGSFDTLKVSTNRSIGYSASEKTLTLDGTSTLANNVLSYRFVKRK